MTKKFFILILVLTATLTIGAFPAIAQAGPEPVYVDPYRTEGNEDGSKSNPYNSKDEGAAYAQSQPSGGYLYIKNQDGTWSSPEYIPSVMAGRGGTPIPSVTLYIILGGLAVLLVLIGLMFQRRSRNLKVG